MILYMNLDCIYKYRLVKIEPNFLEMEPNLVKMHSNFAEIKPILVSMSMQKKVVNSPVGKCSISNKC